MSSGNEGQAPIAESFPPVHPDNPYVVHQGRYRLYEKPDGGLHLVYQRDDKDTPDHMELPGAVLTMARAFSEGNMSIPEMLREMMKLRNTGGS